jgi:hypothetical protein
MVSQFFFLFHSPSKLRDDITTIGAIYASTRFLVLTSRDINCSYSHNHTTWFPSSTDPSSLQSRHSFRFFSFRFVPLALAEENLLLTSTHLLGYIGEFEIIDDHRSGKIVIQLNGHLNKTGVISPRFNIQVTQIENWVNLLLPARGFGILILVRGHDC